MKQVEYLTKELSDFVEKLDLPSSIITSYSDIEVPFDWGVFIIRPTLEKQESVTKTK